jgi:hypothetical protein
MLVGDMVDVAIPLRCVTTATLTGVLVGIIVVDDIDKPDTVAEMTMPTVSHNFWANTKAPRSFVRGFVVKAQEIRQANPLGPRHHTVP